MKRILLLAFIASAMSSCFIFKKKEKYGCPTNGRNVGAEKIASGDEKAIRASNKARFKGN
ncbi:MAG: hypothetical protein EOO06_03115 [Chitinophagaceae bacterium]|nr:MAG: hypothetical protein EOO06_03115 [Chitinophagaceae bacterium]